MSTTQLSARTLETYGREVERFDRFFRDAYGRHPQEASRPELVRYLADVASRRLTSASSLSVHSAAIKHWYQGTHGRGIELPVARPATEELPRLLTREELHRLLRHTRSHPCGKMIRLIYGGARLNEVIRVRVADLNFEGRSMQLRTTDDTPGRTIAIPGALRYELYHETYGKEPDAFLFSLRRDHSGECLPVSTRTVQTFLARAGEEVGLGRISVQTLRESLIARLLRWGLDPRRIAELIGVKNPRSIHKLRRHVTPVNRRLRLVRALDS